MVISETTVRPWPLFGIHVIASFVNPFTSDGTVEHPRMDSLRVVEQIPWFAFQFLTLFCLKAR
ncbi:hypothetical protein DIY08_09470 [Shewanella xiamenensis]|nr:hypothetical protein DIY08_09470 [Shewanella xiamenensis]